MVPDCYSMTEEEIIKRAADVFSKIEASLERSGRSADAVKLVAVSKRQPPWKMKAYQKFCGDKQAIFGENYVQEFQQKKPELEGGFRVHLIGVLQSNKAPAAVKLFDVIESIHSLKTAQAVNTAAQKINKRQEVLLQVNISGDRAKSGFKPEELKCFLSEEACRLDNLSYCGLMTITRYYDTPEDVRPDFIRMRELAFELFDSFKELFKGREISMGMSRDYQIAIEEGATLVRVGSAIFGERK
ncbi:MAG: YggS family pyridoxal phosphate-dependent enzyme [Candidatus Dadabacteria bacterium]|nr:MAG: YggS family pyridoxal phosphate-dependent enzyme [Candidatus Dadabacteria bacterium]